VLVAVAEPEHVHVPDHEAHYEGREVGRPAQRLGREVRERDHGEDGYARRFVPDSGPRRRGDGVAENRAGKDPDQAAERELLDELQRRAGEGEPAGLDDADERQGEHRGRNVVEGGLCDDRLGHFGPEFQALEEGNEYRGVRRGQHGSYEQGHGEGDPVTRARPRARRLRP
jgi:hypothetical protein